MRLLISGFLLALVCGLAAWQSGADPAGGQRAAISVDYPREGSVFPPEFPPPRFEWRDAAPEAAAWTVEVGALRFRAAGERIQIGEIDPRCVGPTNKPPALTPEQAAARSWRPDAASWEAIRELAAADAATVTITGYRDAGLTQPVSSGHTSIRIARDPVGAQIFYRDVPLMPSDTEKGVIKPLAPKSLPLIGWRVRNIAEPRSRLVMTGLYSCANCHSVSADGKTMGMDLDGPRNDKGLYALFPIQPQAAIRKDNVVTWSTFRGKLGGKLRVAFMSQVSPDGQYVATTINDPGQALSDYQRRLNPRDFASNYYVANFKDYRFLQVFYPTRGVLAWYSRASGKLQALPGADDPRYVHTNAIWSPDGKYLVFSRAEARDPYTPGVKMAAFANDPAETQIRYDLYRIPFNGGRGGTPEPIAGASANGMSNSFPRITPDGRWIVFVQSKNGQLMRPDGQLYMVPVAGGKARRMNCNTPLMNSWHSFSPNGRWMVFSSKSRSPYTQMFLTHIDEQGNDSPAILIENSTAANRAVNLPEFVNIPPDGLLKINAPVADFYHILDTAENLMDQGKYAAAIAECRKALALEPDEAMVHNMLGVALARSGQFDEAIRHSRRTIELGADYPDAHNNLGAALLATGHPAEAQAAFQRAVALNPDYAEAYSNLGTALAQQGRVPEAIPHLQQAVKLNGGDANARKNLGLALYMTGRMSEAIPQVERAVKLSGGRDTSAGALLGRLYAESGRFAEAAAAARTALSAATAQGDAEFAADLRARIAEYEARSGRR